MSVHKNIYYKRNTNKIYLWEVDDNGDRHQSVIKPSIDYYIEDHTKQSGITDIFGTPVKRQVSRNVFAMNKSIEIGNLKTCEANIDQDIKFLQKRYNNTNTVIDIDNYNICTIDIEVEVGDDPKPFDQMVDDCENVINCITVHYSSTGKTYTWGNQEYTGNYLDIDPDWTYYYIPDETAMLESFIKHFRRQKVDIISGWNCLNENSSVWLDDKIVKIKDSLVGTTTYNDGAIKNVVNTGCKESYDITLYDGSVVNASDTHVFPVYYKEKGKYTYPQPLLNSKEDLKVSQIDLDKYDYYMRVDLRNNNNIDYAIDGTVIDNDLLYLLGMLYTDGSVDRKDNILMIYNKDRDIISKVLSIMDKFKLRRNSITVDECYKNGRDGDDTYRVRFSFKNNIFNSVIGIVYNNDLRKDLNISEISKLSYTQFMSFMSGCIDGDGWVEKTGQSVGFCNYNNDDIRLFSELLKWNGIYNVLYDHVLRIPNRDINSNFYDNLMLQNKKKRDRLHIGNIIISKNSPSKKLKQFFYDGYYLIKIKDIVSVGVVDMYDIETESHYFNTTCGVKTHNCKLFDMRYLIDRADVLGIDLKFSPINIYDEAKQKDQFENTIKYYKIAGISILDGQELFKNFTYKKQVSYSLQAIGQLVCGEGKNTLDDSINTAYKTNWNQFVEYNIQDVILVTKIEAKKKFIELAITLATQARIPFEGVFSSIKVITGYMLSYLHKFGLVMPDVEKGMKEKYPGAFVKALRGVYKNLVSYDFASLYPTIIRMFNISPETLVLDPDPEDIPNLIKTPASTLYECDTPKGHFSVSGIYYKKDKQGVLPKIVETIYFERVDFKNKAKVAKGIAKNYDVATIAKNNHWDIEKTRTIYDQVIEEGYDEKYYDSQQMIRKILINSMYGVLGNRFFSFYNIKNAMAITIAGRDVIEYVSDAVNNYFHNHWHKSFYKYFPEYSHLKGKLPKIKNDMIPVVDTDSNYICLDEVIQGLGLTFKDNEEYRLWVDYFDTKFLTPFFNKILKIYAKKYNAENLHDFKREKIIVSKLVLKKKKYADIVIENEGDVYLKPKLAITGIDIVKTSTASYFKTALTDILESMLLRSDIDEIGDKLRMYREEFKHKSISDVAAPRSVNNYTKYSEPADVYVEHGDVIVKPHTPQHVKSSMYYNFLIKKKKIMLPFISNGSKVKVIYINPNNILRTEIISFVGDFPTEFNQYFKIDYNKQFYKGFLKLVEDFYDAFGWGNVVIEKNNITDFIEF